jgi:hypothetical protein
MTPQQQQKSVPPPKPRYRNNAPHPSQHQDADPNGDEYHEGEEYYDGGEEQPWVMEAPWFKSAGEQYALFVCWQPFPKATGYELQMMKCLKKKPKWETIAPNLKGCEVKKKVSIVLAFNLFYFSISD